MVCYTMSYMEIERDAPKIGAPVNFTLGTDESHYSRGHRVRIIGSGIRCRSAVRYLPIWRNYPMDRGLLHGEDRNR